MLVIITDYVQITKLVISPYALKLALNTTGGPNVR